MSTADRDVDLPCVSKGQLRVEEEREVVVLGRAVRNGTIFVVVQRWTCARGTPFKVGGIISPALSSQPRHLLPRGDRAGLEGALRSSAGDLFPSGYATRLMRIGSSRDTHPKTGQNRGTSRPIWHYAALRGTTWHKSAPYILVVHPRYPSRAPRACVVRRLGGR